MKPKFSIRYKFLSVMSALLAGCVLIYLLLAIRVFKMDKTELVYDLNRSMVSNLASEIETLFRSAADKLELFALLSHEKAATRQVVNELLKKDSDIVYVSLSRGDSAQAAEGGVFVNQAFADTYSINSDFFETTLAREKPVPFKAIQQTGEEIWNATVKDGPPLVGYGRSVIREDENGQVIDRLAVVSYIRADKILKSLDLVKLSEVFVVNGKGHVLVHEEIGTMIEGADTKEHPLVQAALKHQTKTSVMQFNDSRNEEVLGAFSKGFNGKVMVIAQVQGNKAFAAVRALVTRSLVFSLMVVTVAFIAAVMLSRSLTRPLATLMGGMEKVSSGDLNTQIEVGTKDEIAILAKSFNTMIDDLKDSRQKLEEINRELENKVKERTRQLEKQNQAVKEAQEALLRTTRLAAVGEIAGRAAHEVLNPLTALMARVQQMQKRLRGDAQEEAAMLRDIQAAWLKDQKDGGFEKLVKGWNEASQLNKEMTIWQEDMENISHVIKGWENKAAQLMKDSDFLISEGNRINRIVGGMRSLSVVRGEKKDMDGHKILSECVNIMADLFNSAEIEIKETYEASDDRIHVDRDEFIQSMTNLLRNSLQAIQAAMKTGPFRGRVELKTKNENGLFTVEISDNGVGISPDNQLKLFESQFSTKSPDEGTGLGLSISRRFMRAFGGDIEFVESMPMVRTVFRVTLPLPSVSQEAAA
ncbi:MAG TPA: ATP-binding protein [Bdellovibrionales bacterium]|nr:ATP-binding protein [Bdellovibrionales bacterium]